MSAPDVVGTFANLRDLGGLPVEGGGITRHGVLFRSDAPYSGDAGPDGVTGWPPSTVVDLRARAESARSPWAWPASTRVVQHELFSAARLDLLPRERAIVESIYRSVVSGVPDRLVAVVGLLDPVGSTLVHCAAGRDRTGIVTALLLLLAGVEQDAVIDDYLCTAPAMPAVIARMRRNGALAEDFEVPQHWLGAPEAAIRLVMDELTGADGGPQGWFAAHGGNMEAMAEWIDRFIQR